MVGWVTAAIVANAIPHKRGTYFLNMLTRNFDPNPLVMQNNSSNNLLENFILRNDVLYNSFYCIYQKIISFYESMFQVSDKENKV
jgi:hypothetical protein